MKTEVEKAQAWIDEEKKKGLVDIKLFLTGNPTTLESVSKEFNEMVAAPVVADTSLF